MIVLIVSLTTKGRASAGVLANIRPDSNTPTRVTAVSTNGELLRLVSGDSRRLTTGKTTRWDVGGSTFNAPKPDPAQINGHCQASLLRASGGRILFANPHTAHGRCNGTVLLSTDPSAKTWTREIPLGSSAVEAFAYSCLTHLPADNDSVGLIFETADPPGCAGVSCQLRFRTV